MTNTLDDARDIVRHVEQTGLVFCLTHNYSGYPMVRQARAMVEGGQLGELRLVQVEYVQGGKAWHLEVGAGGDIDYVPVVPEHAVALGKGLRLSQIQSGHRLFGLDAGGFQDRRRDIDIAGQRLFIATGRDPVLVG